MTRALLYCRLSTEEQTRPDYSSLDAQEDTCRRHCAAQEWEVAGVYKDEGFSGKNTARPELTRMMADAQRGLGTVIVVSKLDRATRSLYDFLNIDAQLSRAGCSLVSVRESFDTSTPIGRAMRALLLVFAQLERETIVQRVKDKHTALMAAGRWPGGAVPYGYRKCPGGLEIDPVQAEVVRRIYADYVRGISILEIARSLNREGIPPKRPNYKGRTVPQWDNTTVRVILKGDTHRGVCRYGPRTAEWPFEQIVPPDVVSAVDMRLKARSQKRGPSQVRYELSGLLQCGVCGRKFRISRRGDREYLYCRDMHPMTGGTCGKGKTTPNELLPLGERIAHAVATAGPPPAPVDNDDAGRLLSIRARRERIITLYLEGRIDTLRYQSEVAACDTEEAGIAGDAAPDLEALSVLAEQWDSLNLVDRNALLTAVTGMVIVYPDRYDVHLKPTAWQGWETLISVLR